MKSKIKQQNKIKSIVLYAYFLAFQGLISCTLPSTQTPPQPESQAAQIAADRQALIQAFEQLHQQAFELESYMDTARINLQNGGQWRSEHAEILERFNALKTELENTRAQLGTHKHNLKVLKAPSSNAEVQPPRPRNE